MTTRWKTILSPLGRIALAVLLVGGSVAVAQVVVKALEGVLSLGGSAPAIYYVAYLTASVLVAYFVYRAYVPMTNVVRHAKARECVVRISAGSALEVEVSDDGTGMPETNTPGVGFSSMRERAEELGGECKVERIPDGGTRVLARLPLPAPENTKDQVPDD